MVCNIKIKIVLNVLCILSSGYIGEQVIASSIPEYPKGLVDSINEFGYKLLKQMMRQKENSNVVISPTGVAGLLAMTLLGSAGASYDELADTLGFSQDILENHKNHESIGRLLAELNDNSTSSKTLYADAMFVDEQARLREVFRSYLKRVYRAEAIRADFQQNDRAKDLINDWVKQHTNGEIVNFLQQPLPVDTRVVLLSALYFSGQWKQPFLPESTRTMEFKKPSGEVLVDLMLNFGEFNYTYSQTNELQLIQLPYNDSVTSMYVLKPRAYNKPNLFEALNQIDFSRIDELINQLEQSECVIRFPKMVISSMVNLEEPLKNLGVKSIFKPGEANFALVIDDNKIDNGTEAELLRRLSDRTESRGLKDRINSLPNPGVHIDAILHDVKISIDEFGTEAVAATSGVLARSANLFYANSPFYMFIRNEKTKLVTFSAAIYDPTENVDSHM